jgi:hypothetical protein
MTGDAGRVSQPESLDFSGDPARQSTGATDSGHIGVIDANDP